MLFFNSRVTHFFFFSKGRFIGANLSAERMIHSASFLEAFIQINPIPFKIATHLFQGKIVLALFVVFHEILVISERNVGFIEIHPSDHFGINKKRSVILV